MKRLLGTYIPVLFTSLPVMVTMSATHAHAVQTHGGAEGLVSHQLGHCLFFSSMLILLWRLKKAQLAGPGWLEFKVFLRLILLWNVLTFTGHWMHEVVTVQHFTHNGDRVLTFQVDTLSELIFYLTRLDHLLLVPAFFLLLLAIRKWGQDG